MTTLQPVWRVAVLAGGDSDEAVISLRSGDAVYRALVNRGHTVVLLDPAMVDLKSVDWSQFDVAFLALHGRFGEDGQVQEILTAANVCYTGSDAATCRLTFSKSAAKERMLQFGVPTPPYVVVHHSDSWQRLHDLASRIGFPLVVKPDTQGSSLGISIVQAPAELEAAFRRCFEFDQFAVVEQFVAGTEWTVGLLDDWMLPPLCIETSRPFFDYVAKYEDEGTRYRFDVGWPEASMEAMKDAARSVCRAMGVRGLARVDLRMDALHRPWVLEVNTIPGLTDHSLVPKAAAKAGVDFASLCERAIQSARLPAARRPYFLQDRRIRGDLLTLGQL